MIERLQAKRNEEGFTLIELLIVIIVLGILAAIVVFAVSGTRKDAVASRCKTDQKAIELSVEGYYAKNGAYSATAVNGSIADASNVYVAKTPSNGSLLKSWPSKVTEYEFSVPASSGTVQVFKDTGGGVGGVAGDRIMNGSEAALALGCSDPTL